MAAAFSLDGRVAIVTGGGGSLGGGMAEALASAGAEIALADVSKKGMEEVAARIRRQGRRCVNIECDLRERKAPTQMVDAVIGQYGRLDIAVNSAGINIRKPALDYGEEEWNAIIDLNLKALFFCCQAEARAMIPAGGGKIINISSLTTECGLPNRSIYAASKGGVSSMTRVLAVEWVRHDLQVNCIGPGQMLTPFTRELFLHSPEGDRILARIPAGRFGAPDDLAGAVVFLASDASDYIVGQTIYVDGGWLLNPS
jgi:2-deoxy-D-gluconate 3-dehydrogenase